MLKKIAKENILTSAPILAKSQVQHSFPALEAKKLDAQYGHFTVGTVFGIVFSVNEQTTKAEDYNVG